MHAYIPIFGRIFSPNGLLYVCQAVFGQLPSGHDVLSEDALSR